MIPSKSDNIKTLTLTVKGLACAACPCTVAITTPLAVVASMGRAAKKA